MAEETWRAFMDELDNLEDEAKLLVDNRIRILREAKEEANSVIWNSIVRPFIGFAMLFRLVFKPPESGYLDWPLSLFNSLNSTALIVALQPPPSSPNLALRKMDCRNLRAGISRIETRTRWLARVLENQAAELGVAPTWDVLQRAERVIESLPAPADDIVIGAERKMYMTFGCCVTCVAAACAGLFLGASLIARK